MLTQWKKESDKFDAQTTRFSSKIVRCFGGDGVSVHGGYRALVLRL